MVGQQREKQTNQKYQGENRLIAYLCIVPSPKTLASLQGDGFNYLVFFQTQCFWNTFSRAEVINQWITTCNC